MVKTFESMLLFFDLKFQKTSLKLPSEILAFKQLRKANLKLHSL